MHDLVIIHSQDTTSWTDYILGYLAKESFNKKIRILRDAELVIQLDDAETKSAISTAKAIIVIASPIHLQFLIECPRFSYFGLVTDIRRAQIFLCGTEMADFETMDLEGIPIRQRFPDFFGWKKLTHDKHIELLTNAMILMESDEKPVAAAHKCKSNGSNGGKRRRKKEFEITPTKVKCEEPTIVTILFAESISDSADQFTMEIVFRENFVDSAPISIEAKWRNPYTYQFSAPDCPAGVINFTVTLNGTEIGTKTLIYYSGQECLTQVYIHQMARLCSYIRDAGLLTSEVDSLLSEILNDNFVLQIPVQAFEHIFGNYSSKNEDQSKYEFPTLLHLAAKFGLQEFATKLIDLPDARRAYDIPNVHGHLPEIIAKDNGHLELAKLFQDFHVVNETITSVYEIYLPDKRRSNRLSDTSEYSITPTAVLSSSGSEDIYMDMESKKISTRIIQKEGDSESDIDEGGYIDMDDPELSETIQRKKQAEEQKHLMKPESREKDKEEHIKEQEQVQPQTQITDEKTNTEEAIILESLTLEDVRNIADVPESQKELIEILTLVIQQKISVAEGEYLIKGWNFRHNQGRSSSFKDKQIQLSKMRDQVTKAKDKIKEPSWWNSVITVLKKSPSSTTPTQSTLAPSAESVGVSGLSASKSVRQPSFENIVIGTKSRKLYKLPTKHDPHVSENVQSVLEPISESPHRNSNASASSRESLLSVTSRTSTSSGVDIDTVDEEHISELEVRVRNPQQGSLDYGMRHLTMCKRKSRNLEILEEELTCSDAPCPPPLPPRTGPKTESFRTKASMHTATSPKPEEPIKHSLTSISLPPIPHQLRDRSCSDGCIKPIESIDRQFTLKTPLWKSCDQPPPVSPRVLRKDSLQSSQRRPAPPEPTPVGPADRPDAATHTVDKAQNENVAKPLSGSMTNRPYVQSPVPSVGRASMIRSRSRDKRAKSPLKKGMLSREAAVTDPDAVLLETTESLDDRSISKSCCDNIYPSESDAADGKVDMSTFLVRRTQAGPQTASFDQEIDQEIDREIDRENVVPQPRFQAESRATIDASEKQTTNAHQQKQQLLQQEQKHPEHHPLQLKQQQQEQSHHHQFQDQHQQPHRSQDQYRQQEEKDSEVEISTIIITTTHGGQEIEEDLSVKYAKIEPSPTILDADNLRSNLASSADDALLSSNDEYSQATQSLRCLRKSRNNLATKRPTPVFQDQKPVYPESHGYLIQPEAKILTAHEADDSSCVDSGICLPLCKSRERVDKSPIGMGTPTDSGIRRSEALTMTETTGTYDAAYADAAYAVVTTQSPIREKTRETEMHIDELKNFLSRFEAISRHSQSESPHIPSFPLQKTGSSNAENVTIVTTENTLAAENPTYEAIGQIPIEPPMSELPLTLDKRDERTTLLPETLAESCLVSNTAIFLLPADVPQDSCDVSSMVIVPEQRKRSQRNVIFPGEAELSEATEDVDPKHRIDTDTADKLRTKKGLSASLKESVKFKLELDTTARRSEKIPTGDSPQLAVEKSNVLKKTDRNKKDESSLELTSASLQTGEFSVEKPMTESVVVIGKPSAENQPYKEGSDELSTAPLKCPPAKLPKVKRADRSNSESALKGEKPHKLQSSTGKTLAESRPRVISPRPQLKKFPSLDIDAQEEDAATSGCREASAKLISPPRVPSKPFNAARK